MNQTKENFLNQFTCKNTQAFARQLYELNEQSIATGKLKSTDAVLEILDIYDEISDKELKNLGIELIAA